MVDGVDRLVPVLRGDVRLGLMAAGGVLTTHLLTFAATAPDAHERARLLERTGHVSPTLAAAAAMAVLVGAAVRLLPVRRRVVRLVAIQTVGWVGLESLERLTHEHASWEIGVIALGVVVQAALALVGALMLRAVRRVFAVLAGRRRERPAPVRPAPPGLLHAARQPAVLAGAAGLRGPPCCS